MGGEAQDIPGHRLRTIWALALGGFIPFGGLSVAVYTGLNLGFAIGPLQLFILWSVIILSFLGGIRWGMAISAKPIQLSHMILSVVPCIIAWFSMLLATPYTIATLLALYIFHGIWDYSYLSQMPWFAKLRAVLTILVASAHMIVLLALL